MKPRLSPRQKQLISLVLLEGIGLKAAAGRLKISHSTARCHMRIVYARLGVDGMAGFLGRYVDRTKVEEDVA